MRHLLLLAAGALLPSLVLWPPAAAATQFFASGAVEHAGVHELAGPARLSDAALAAGVREDAYVLGAAWLRPGLRMEQQRQQAGILFDLDHVRRQALASDRIALAEFCASLSAWLGSMPSTGRQAAPLDPRVVEVMPSANRPVAQGDVLYYPTRPSTIRIVGAVSRTCELPQVALQDARRYLDACPALPLADADWIFVIQPDGQVFRQGIGLWNRSTPLPLAPGAVVYVPLGDRLVRDVAPDLNREIATFLATQPLADPEAHP